MLRSRFPILLLMPFLIGIPAYCAASVAPSAPALEAVNFNLYSTRRPANAMLLSTIAGSPVSLDSLKGKVVILNFWRIDCRPCAAEKPLLERLYRKYAKRGLEILAVNLSDSPDRIKDYVGHGGYSFTFVHDPHHRLSLKRHRLPSGMATSFVVNSDSEAIYEITGVPTSYLIDRDGCLVGHSAGLTNWERGPLRELLESLLGPRTLSASNPRLYTPRAVIDTGATPTVPQSAEPLDGWQGEASDAPAQAGRVILAQRPLPMEGDAPPKSPDVLPPAPPAPPAVPPRRRPTASSVAPAPGATPSARAAVPQPRSPSARTLPRASTRRQDPRQAYRPAAPRGSLAPETFSQRRPVARSVRPGRSYQRRGPDPLPELPRALPYSRSRGGGKSDGNLQQVSPDKNGYVTARVPGQGRSLPDRLPRTLSNIPEAEPLPPAMGTSRTLPPAQTLRNPSPIGGFILESFTGDSQASPPVAQQPLRVRPLMPQPLQPQPPAGQSQRPSLLGRVKDTLSWLNPFQ